MLEHVPDSQRLRPLVFLDLIQVLGLGLLGRPFSGTLAAELCKRIRVLLIKEECVRVTAIAVEQDRRTIGISYANDIIKASAVARGAIVYAAGSC